MSGNRTASMVIVLWMMMMMMLLLSLLLRQVACENRLHPASNDFGTYADRRLGIVHANDSTIA
jgi:hypothetical protein